ISIWTWSKAIEEIAERAGVAQFTTHTLRHLCLTDLARAGWDLHEIATFAGHRSTDSTLQYIHLSGRDLAKKLEQGMAEIHAWRLQNMTEVLSCTEQPFLFHLSSTGPSTWLATTAPACSRAASRKPSTHWCMPPHRLARGPS